MELGLIAHPLLVRQLCFVHTDEVKKYMSINVFLCLVVGYTNNGDQCKNRCAFYDKSYNWCYTVDQVDSGWDYCTPTGEFILDFLTASSAHAVPKTSLLFDLRL